MVACPKDNTPLRKQKLGKFEGEVCPTCDGTWLRFDIVKGLYESTYIHAPSKFYHDEKPDLDYISWDSEFHCPSDEALFRTYKFRGVEIDICPLCKGLWLDTGEIERLYVKKGSDIIVRFLWWIHYS